MAEGILAEVGNLDILVVGMDGFPCFGCCNSQRLDHPGAPWLLY